MRYFLSGAAVLAIMSWVNLAQPAVAQSLRSVGGPAETPPANFQGQQYVDSRGCVFMRAGLNGQVTWVARIGRDRRPICNDVTSAQAIARLASPEVVPKSAPVAAPKSENIGKPMATIASKIVAQPQIGVQVPITVPGLGGAVVSSKVVAQNTVAQNGAVQNVVCPKQAPVLTRMALRTGGVVLVCTHGDGGKGGWLPPNLKGVGASFEPARPTAIDQAPLQAMVAQGASDNGVQVVIAGQAVASYQAGEKTTYVAAWKDGRLNPLRGVGTAQGWAAQDQVWTRATPAKSVAQMGRSDQGPNVAAAKNQRLSASTRSKNENLAAPMATGARYVQVGTFGNPQNVANVGRSLAALGLPVSKSATSKAGRDLVIVFAGPFASNKDAEMALGLARRAGFSDAFLR
jgi:hypothetical protein